MVFNPTSFTSGVLYPALRYIRTLVRSPAHRNLLSVAKRVKRKPRFSIGDVRISRDLDLRYADNASFLSTFDEIFVNEIYRFSRTKTTPFVIDAGANIGLASVYWTMCYPDVEGFAFEPDPKIYQILCTNLERCKSRIRPIQAALGAMDGDCTFEPQGGDAGRVVVNEFESNSTTAESLIKTKVLRLSQYLNRPIDFLKIDVEGFELIVLEEIKACLPVVERLFVESHCFRDERDSLPDVLTILRDAGFRTSMDIIASAYRGFDLVVPDREIESNVNIYGRRS